MEDEFFLPGEYGWGTPKSLGIATPVDLVRQTTLHSNWSVSPCERFFVRRLKVRDFLCLLSKYFILAKHRINLSYIYTLKFNNLF